MTSSGDRTTDQRLEGLSAEARLFFSYWDNLPKEGLIPRRGQIDPTMLKDLLPDLVICKYVFDNPPAIILRLVGTRHVMRWGRELTGVDYLDLVPPERRPLAWARNKLIVEHPCGTHSYRIETFASGGRARLESTALPLRDNDGKADMMILYSREAPDERLEPWKLGAGQAFADSLQSRFIDIGAGVPAGPAT